LRPFSTAVLCILIDSSTAYAENSPDDHDLKAAYCLGVLQDAKEQVEQSAQRHPNLAAVIAQGAQQLQKGITQR
jgi:hypothetical protein